MRRRSLLCLLAIGCGGAHRHSAPASEDPHRLFVEISVAGAHRDHLDAGVKSGLSKVGFARVVERGGDVKLQVEVAKLDVVGNEVVCRVKVLVLRLPSHDLLGIADGGARAGGTDAQAGDDCIEGVSASLIRTQVRTLLKRRLDDKR
ncbi:MAG: hypothetical protein M3680_09130 [Myxococcota bacterium]|nr:hypothetical protein [Myxococcota bacterium]